MASYYPPVGFHFTVEFGDLPNPKGLDVCFQSASGLEVSLETETLKEGGENRFEHVLPTRTKYTSLTLKRGLLLKEQSGITAWCIEAFKNRRVKPANLTVSLLNQEHNPLVVWQIFHAWPKSWKFNELNADKGEIFVETLELHYNRFEVQDGPDGPGSKRPAATS